MSSSIIHLYLMLKHSLCGSSRCSFLTLIYLNRTSTYFELSALLCLGKAWQTAPFAGVRDTSECTAIGAVGPAWPAVLYYIHPAGAFLG